MKNIEKIFDFLKQNGKLQYSILKKNFDSISESTLIRNLEKLLHDGRVQKIYDGRKTFYSIMGKEFIHNYLKEPFFQRPKKSYDFNFLKNYIPNKTSFLGDKYTYISEKYRNIEKLATYNYLKNIRGIENLLIDLTYASSKLEGNTYSYLDTEVLVKYNEKREGKTTEETQMILNHKNVIKYLIENRNKIQFDKNCFYEIHSILGKNLLFEDYLGKIRQKEVRIGGSTYVPLDNYFLLEQEWSIFLEKINLIQNPFEQALFILVFIPYFQIFMDINKRTSRIGANISLIKNGLVPISLLQVKEKDYITAILAIYELQDVTLMRDIFVDNYLLNFDRYISE